MLNKIILIGRLVRDVDLKYTQSGIAVATFTLAVDRGFKNANGERETDFIDITVWKQQAENCANYLSKGKLVAVEGSLQIRTYEKDGQKRKIAEVVANNVQFLSPMNERVNERSEQQTSHAPSPDNDQLGDEDLPF